MAPHRLVFCLCTLLTGLLVSGLLVDCWPRLGVERGLSATEAAEGVRLVDRSAGESAAEIDLGTLLHKLPESLRGPLAEYVKQELSDPAEASVERFVAGFSAALSAGGMSEEGIRQTIATLITQGFYRSADARRAADTLRSLSPDALAVDRLLPASCVTGENSPLPTAGVRLEWLGSAGGHFSELDLARLNRGDDDWLPADASELPVTLTLDAFGLATIDAPARNQKPSSVLATDSLRIAGTIVAWTSQPGSEPLLEQTFEASMGTAGTRLVTMAEVPVYLPAAAWQTSPDDGLTVCVRYEVTQHGPGIDDAACPRFSTEFWTRLIPVDRAEITTLSTGQSGPIGFRAVSLDPVGNHLESADLIDLPASPIHSLLLYQKEFWRKEFWHKDSGGTISAHHSASQNQRLSVVAEQGQTDSAD